MARGTEMARDRTSRYQVRHFRYKSTGNCVSFPYFSPSCFQDNAKASSSAHPTPSKNISHVHSVIQVEQSPRKHEALHICYVGCLLRLIPRRTSSSISARSAKKATPLGPQLTLHPSLGSYISISGTDWDCTFQLPGRRWRYWTTNWFSAPTLADQRRYRASNRLPAPALTHKWRYPTFNRLPSSTLTHRITIQSPGSPVVAHRKVFSPS